MKRVVDDKRVKNNKKYKRKKLRSIRINQSKIDIKMDPFVTSKTKKKNTLPIYIFRLISCIIIIICLFLLNKWIQENKANKDILNNIQSQVSFSTEQQFLPQETTTPKPNEYSRDFEILNDINQDTIGWLHINNTDINHPIVQTKNNDYYMTHNFKKEYNSAGWIFADYRNNFNTNDDKNTIIYGHNRKDGSMFSSLNNILDKNWHTDPTNQIITLYTANKKLQYRIFAVYTINAEEFENLTEFKTEKEYQNYINNSIQHSIYNFNTKVSTEDKIITIYTCANNNIDRIILQGKLITD